jgi:hypothetical protein
VLSGLAQMECRLSATLLSDFMQNLIVQSGACNHACIWTNNPLLDQKHLAVLLEDIEGEMKGCRLGFEALSRRMSMKIRSQ